jgi:hypothetical protein
MADADPFAQYVAPEPKAAAAPAGEDPFAQYVAPAEASSAAPEPSLVDKAKRAASAVAQPFKDMAVGGWNALGAVGNAMVHPVSTARSIAANPGAAVRETMRGVNDNIPFANSLVSALPGGAPESSPEDSAAFPNARTIGSVAGTPLAGMTGELAGKAIGAVADKAASIAAARKEQGVYQGLGRAATGNNKARLMDLGQEATGAVDREFGISKAADPRAAIKQAKEAVGNARAAAYQAISQAGGDADMGAVAKRLDDLQVEFGAHAGTRQFAKDVAALRGDLLRQYGETGKVPAAKLQEEIAAINEGAFGGNYQNPKTAQIVQRRTAGALREVYDRNLDAVAKLGPEQQAAVKEARAANRKFEVLKTMEPIVKAKAVKAEFAPTTGEKVKEAIKHPFHASVNAAGYLGSKAIDGAAGAVANTAAPVAEALTGPGRVVSDLMPGGPVAKTAARVSVGPVQVARLLQMARSGATREALAAQAEQDGTPPELAANIAQQFGR